jgi:hypothetical protein
VKNAKWLHLALDSSGRRNKVTESFSRRLVVSGFPWSLDACACHGMALGLCVCRHNFDPQQAADLLATRLAAGFCPVSVGLNVLSNGQSGARFGDPEQPRGPRGMQPFLAARRMPTRIPEAMRHATESRPSFFACNKHLATQPNSVLLH